MRRIACALLLCALPAAAQSAAEAYAREIATGVQLFHDGKYDEAALNFARARQLDPADWRGHAWHAMALVQQALDEQQDAVRRSDLFRQGEKIASDLIKRAGLGFTDPLYEYIMGVIASVRNDDPAALTLLKKAATAPRERYAPYQDILLRLNARRAYAKASTRIATRLIVIGEFEEADKYLAIADRNLPKDDPARQMLERKMGVVAEYLGRLEEAVQHLRTCIALNKDRPEVKLELTGSIAMIWFAAEKLEKGKAALAELPANCTHPEVLVARAMLLYKEAMRDPGGPVMDKAIAYHLQVMDQLAAEDVYRLAEQFADLVMEKVTPRDLEDNKALVEKTVALVQRELKRRPECPGLYFALYRLYKLLGNDEKASFYQGIHARKKKEWEHKEQYDQRGRPRCR